MPKIIWVSTIVLPPVQCKPELKPEPLEIFQFVSTEIWTTWTAIFASTNVTEVYDSSKDAEFKIEK